MSTIVAKGSNSNAYIFEAPQAENRVNKNGEEI